MLGTRTLLRSRTSNQRRANINRASADEENQRRHATSANVTTKLGGAGDRFGYYLCVD